MMTNLSGVEISEKILPITVVTFPGGFSTPIWFVIKALENLMDNEVAFITSELAVELEKLKVCFIEKRCFDQIYTCSSDEGVHDLWVYLTGTWKELYNGN